VLRGKSWITLIISRYSLTDYVKYGLNTSRTRTRLPSELLVSVQEEQPYKFVALEGVKGLVQNGGSKILPVIPHLIVPIRNAINTRRTSVIVQTLDALKMLLLSDVRSPTGPMVARALVPYYRQILPVLNIFYSHNKNLGDQTDYGQRRGDVLGDRIEEVREITHTAVWHGCLSISTAAP
jgi:hypothetical protein